MQKNLSSQEQGYKVELLMSRITKLALFVLFLCSIGAFVEGVWLYQRWEDVKQSELEAAYRNFLPEPSAPITNRYYEKQVVFTDSVERFRFDGVEEALVDHIVQKYNLSLATEPANSRFKPPDWWHLPESGVYYIRGTGHEYRMLVYDPTINRVFFEATQD